MNVVAGQVEQGTVWPTVLGWVSRDSWGRVRCAQGWLLGLGQGTVGGVLVPRKHPCLLSTDEQQQQ